MRWLMLLLGLIWLPTAFAVDMTRLQQALDKARIDNGVSAMQMTVILASGQHVNVVSGNMQKGKSPLITPNTLFQIGSNTKSYTAALLVQLQVDKKLKLSDPVSKYFPEYKKWSQITLSQLLHNNSGIPSYSEDKTFQAALEQNPKRVWTPTELVNIAAALPIDFRPGEGWHYSNTNYILAGMIAEKVSGKKLNDLYNDLIIKKLNLKNTYYLPTVYTSAFLNRMAHGYDDQNKDVTTYNMSWAGAAGAMVANSDDLATWAYSLFHGKVLKQKELADMMNVVSTKTGLFMLNTNEGYGMGLGMRSSELFGRWYGHEGETIGYHSMFIWFPESDITVAINTNGEATKLRAFGESVPGLLA